ncbi:gigasin-6-like isoform X2 [Ruditapes philippinarum]|uniref:gigasin-6-like isoform X2 n=1 Tax=Ruditapes philippinarum TaxID=129788 RepID=UPI00295ADA08|nr:gigasin-6-like isoform X2 [Ruditapes philippinarum]
MEKGNAWKHFTLWCILLFIQYSNPQEIFDHTFIQDLDRFIQKTMVCRYIPGLTISVVKDSKTWTKSYGTADFSNGRMVDNSTQFVIGSIGKSFTMVLLGILLTEKGLNWNTKVHDLLGPKYEFIDKYRSKEMTLKDMLSHRTGLAALPIVLDAGYPESVTRKQLSLKMKHLPQLFSFRDGFVYNNFMYMYLGHISDKLGGDTWENLLQSKVFLPIGMTSTQVLKQPEDLLKDKVAKPYIFRNNEFQNGTLNIYSIHPLEPAGAIISTWVDMAKYIRFNLNNGTTEDGKTLLNRALLNEAFTATTPTVNSPFLNSNTLTRPEFPVSDTIIGSGYGWRSAAYRGFRKIWHAGGLFSYVSDVWMFPEINAGLEEFFIQRKTKTGS